MARGKKGRSVKSTRQLLSRPLRVARLTVGPHTPFAIHASCIANKRMSRQCGVVGPVASKPVAASASWLVALFVLSFQPLCDIR